MTWATLFRAILGALAAAWLAAVPAARAETEPPMLVVVDVPRQTETAFAREDLEALRQITIRTTTIWTDGVQEFRGVPLSEVLKAAEATGSRIVLSATNDYMVEMPMDEVTADVPLLAMSVNGAAMTRRDKGPLWVVYPYDLSTAYQSEVIYTRSVWQLERIEVLP